MVTIKDIGPNYNIEELKHFIDRFTETSILVIGDLILDKYISVSYTHLTLPTTPYV